MKFNLFFLLIFFSFFSYAQKDDVHLAFPETDSLYREDQFYISGTFHIIEDRPLGISQSGFSGGLHLGFIRDMPFTKRRNWALGLGLGYSLNTYNHDLLIIPDSGRGTTFREITDDDDLDINRSYTHLIEVPLELRWRTSTPESYKFWRVYAGMRLGYMHYFKSDFKSNSGVQYTDKSPDGLDRLRLGATLTFGWNTFNFHLYYSLNSLFDNSVTVVDQTGALEVLKIGLMFYIL